MVLVGIVVESVDCLGSTVVLLQCYILNHEHAYFCICLCYFQFLLQCHISRDLSSSYWTILVFYSFDTIAMIVFLIFVSDNLLVCDRNTKFLYKNFASSCNSTHSLEFSSFLVVSLGFSYIDRCLPLKTVVSYFFFLILCFLFIFL